MTESTPHTHDTPNTGVTESDPNADGPDGLAGDMGVSSERVGGVRGSEPDGEQGSDAGVTYGTAPTHPSPEEVGAPTGEDVPPEQSRPGQDDAPEANPDPVEVHDHDPDRNPRHGV